MRYVVTVSSILWKSTKPTGKVDSMKLNNLKLLAFSLVISCIFSYQNLFATDFDAIVRGVKAGTSLVGNAYETLSGITGSIRENNERRRFEHAIRGGFSIYLGEDKSSRTSVRPVIVPFAIDVVKATVRSEDGKLETENATRSAKKIFDGELEEKTLVRKRKFMRNEFGYVNDPSPGQRKVLDIWYRCLDDRKFVVSDNRHEQAHEMNNIELSCKDVPSVYKGKLGS